jgi:glycosyltransferase involved in cell wall biosynthesis
VSNPLNHPIISVVMSVHNGEAHIGEAVDSILNQTIRDFEFIIIDDGSQDSSKAMLRQYAARDPRIRLVSRENRGLTKSLNEGLALAQGEFIARMDADDISLPARFEKQLGYLKSSPTLMLLSTNLEVIDEFGARTTDYLLPLSFPEILWWSMFANPFAHPAMMLRRSLIDQHGFRYDESFRTTQDFDLWVRIINRHPGENLGESLLKYRRHPNTIEKLLGDDRTSGVKRVRRKAFVQLFKRFDVTVDDPDLASGQFLVRGDRRKEDVSKNKQRFTALLDICDQIRVRLGLQKANCWVQNGYLQLLHQNADLITNDSYYKAVKTLAPKEGILLTARMVRRRFKKLFVAC